MYIKQGMIAQNFKSKVSTPWFSTCWFVQQLYWAAQASVKDCFHMQTGLQVQQSKGSIVVLTSATRLLEKGVADTIVHGSTCETPIGP